MFVKLTHESNEFYEGKRLLSPRRHRITILPELDTPSKDEIAALENEWVQEKIAAKHYQCRVPTCKKELPKGKVKRHMVKHHARQAQMHFACHAVDCEALFLDRLVSCSHSTRN